jgi:hypothetical protein
MKYDAISIDTSIFDQYNLNLESGLFAQLSQFNEGTHKFILADIVVAEVRQHMIIQAERAFEQLSLSLRNGHKYGLVTSSAKQHADLLSAQMIQASDAVDERIASMQARTDFEKVPARLAKIEDVLDRYFRGLAPFDSSPDKKNEFPDAIALLSLEQWAKSHDARVILVSKDKGWANFAKASPRLDIVSDLATALQRVQDDIAEVGAKVQAALRAIDEDAERHAVRQKIHNELSRQLADRFIIAEANAAYTIDSDYADVSLKSISFVETADGYDTKIVNLERDKVVVRLTVEIDAHASANFSFYMDQDQQEAKFPFSSGEYETSVFRTVAVLFSFSGDLGTEDAELYLDEIELVTGLQLIDFGDIEPSYDDYEDYVDDDHDDEDDVRRDHMDDDIPW